MKRLWTTFHPNPDAHCCVTALQVFMQQPRTQRKKIPFETLHFVLLGPFRLDRFEQQTRYIQLEWSLLSFGFSHCFARQ